MELYFLRHGIAADRDDPKYKDDSLRPLTPEGQKKMCREAQGMKDLGLGFDVILSSPYLRAKQTAEEVANVYNIKTKDIYLTNNLLPPASVEDLLREIQAHFPKTGHVLCVGHEPHLSENISSLLKSARPLNIDLKKGGLCCLSLDQLNSPEAVLRWLLPPALLTRLARRPH